jgi:hypothetical protein
MAQMRRAGWQNLHGRLLAWENAPGGNMRIGRAIIIPAIIALGAAGSIVSGSVMPAAVGHAPSVHVQVAGSFVIPNMTYHA